MKKYFWSEIVWLFCNLRIVTFVLLCGGSLLYKEEVYKVFDDYFIKRR